MNDGICPAGAPAGAICPSYQYEGKCSDRAYRGRVKGSDFSQQPAPEAEVIQAIDLYSPKVFSYGAPTAGFTLTQEGKHQGERALRLSGKAAKKSDPSINPNEPNPYIGGLGIEFTSAPQDLTQATHVQLKVLVPKPKDPSVATVNLIVEIYENDGGNPHSIDKDPNNFYLPEKDDDFWKVVIKLKPTGTWETITLPLASFVDWNKKTDCPTPIPGINEDVGNGIFDLEKGKALAVQLTLVSNDWDRIPKVIHIGDKIKFIKAK